MPDKTLTPEERASKIMLDFFGERWGADTWNVTLRTHIRNAIFDAQCAAGVEQSQLMHDQQPECGRPRACWQDRNWPESEQNYDPETRTSDPPLDYRCVMCEAVRKAEAVMKERAARLVETECAGIPGVLEKAIQSGPNAAIAAAIRELT